MLCLATGLVIVSSAKANPNINYSDGATLINAAFTQIPFIGQIVLTFGLITFAYTTILGWEYYGEKGAEYLFGSKIIVPYRVVYTCFVFVGATIPLGLVWSVADILNAFMVLPNLIAVLLLSKMIMRETQYYVYDGNIDEMNEDAVPLRSELEMQ